MTHWHRITHPGSQWDSCLGRPLEVCIPFTGGDVVDENLQKIRSRRHKTHDFFYDAGWNVTYQHRQAPFVWHFNTELNEENKFKLHVVPDLVFAHLPVRTSLSSDISPINKLSPIDEKMIRKLCELILYCHKMNPQLKFALFVPCTCTKCWKPMTMGLMSDIRNTSFHRMDMCFFNHPFRLQHLVYSNDFLLLNNCRDLYTHDRRNMPCGNRCQPHNDYTSHGYIDNNPERPDRRLPAMFVKVMIEHFTASMKVNNYHYIEAMLTTYSPNEEETETYEEFCSFASQSEKRTHREWLSLKYEEFMDLFYDHPAHDHYNNGYDDNHIRNRPPTPPAQDLNAYNSDATPDKDEMNISNIVLDLSVVLPDDHESAANEVNAPEMDPADDPALFDNAQAPNHQPTPPNTQEDNDLPASDDNQTATDIPNLPPMPQPFSSAETMSHPPMRQPSQPEKKSPDPPLRQPSQSASPSDGGSSSDGDSDILESPHEEAPSCYFLKDPEITHPNDGELIVYKFPYVP